MAGKKQGPRRPERTKATTLPVLKEYFNRQIDMRGPGNPDAKPAMAGAVCILRFQDGRALNTNNLPVIFNEIATDFASTPATAVTLKADMVEVKVENGAVPPGYRQLPPRTVAMRG